MWGRDGVPEGIEPGMLVCQTKAQTPSDRNIIFVSWNITEPHEKTRSLNSDYWRETFNKPEPILPIKYLVDA